MNVSCNLTNPVVQCSLALPSATGLRFVTACSLELVTQREGFHVVHGVLWLARCFARHFGVANRAGAEILG